MKTKKALKVYMAMSGGVDSSVGAYLLQKQGYDVTGVYMKNWSEESFGGKFAKYCPWRKDLADVKNVCRILNIPVKVYNFEKEYNRKVINYFFEGEKKGLTPNPDVVCNREIKFGLFLNKALREGADMIATGHYTRRSREFKIKINHKNYKKIEIYKLYPAKDKNKDQSYFLCTLTQKQLAKSIFPLGDYIKPEIRKIAKQLKLPNADKPESMGICFVGEVKLEEFLKARIKEKHGDIISTEGEVIGKHKGLPFYTIGQRRGIEIGGGMPYYVVGKDLKRNQLIVAKGSHLPQLYSKSLLIKNMHWISGKAPRLPLSCQAIIRYRQDLQRAKISRSAGNLKVSFSSKQRAVTPGQFCALYEKGVLLGGGEIISQ